MIAIHNKDTGKEILVLRTDIAEVKTITVIFEDNRIVTLPDDLWARVAATVTGMKNANDLPG